MNKTKVLTLGLFIALTILINILANALPFNGLDTATISDRNFTYFTPAGITFVIWGVIYLGWIGYFVYHWINVGKKSEWLSPAYPWFLLSCLANMTWLFLWHYEMLNLSVLVMVVLLISLIKVYLVTSSREKPTTQEKLLIQSPISIYLGWISVATIANIASALTKIGWNGFGISEEVWSAIMISVAVILGILMLVRQKDYVYVLVLIWSAFGIAINFRADSSIVFTTAVLGILVLLGGMVVTKMKAS